MLSRQAWAKYMTENIGETRFAFFSAIQEDNPVAEEGETEDQEVGNEKQENPKEPTPVGPAVQEKVPLEADFSDPCEILTSERLIKLFRSFKRFENEDMTVGTWILSC